MVQYLQQPWALALPQLVALNPRGTSSMVMTAMTNSKRKRK